MSLKTYLVTACFGGSALMGGAVYFMLPGATVNAQDTSMPEGVLLAEEAEENFLAVTPPEPSGENADLVPHATPEEAAAIAADFFARPTPTDAELAAMMPFTGTENVRIQRCGEYWPEAAADELSLTKATPERRMKDEIYARLNVQQALNTGDCSCVGKVAPFEPVAIILEEVKKLHGEPTGNLFSVFGDESRRLRSAVERLCNGRF